MQAPGNNSSGNGRNAGKGGGDPIADRLRDHEVTLRALQRARVAAARRCLAHGQPLHVWVKGRMIALDPRDVIEGQLQQD